MNEIVIILISGGVSFAVAYMTAKSGHYSKDVTAERQKWREKIRELSIGIDEHWRNGTTASSGYAKSVAEVRLRLNPDDRDDQSILAMLGDPALTEIQRKKLLAAFARLLKLDWDRTKAEAKWYGWLLPERRDIRVLRSGDYLDDGPAPD